MSNCVRDLLLQTSLCSPILPVSWRSSSYLTVCICGTYVEFIKSICQHQIWYIGDAHAFVRAFRHRSYLSNRSNHTINSLHNKTLNETHCRTKAACRQKGSPKKTCGKSYTLQSRRRNTFASAISKEFQKVSSPFRIFEKACQKQVHSRRMLELLQNCSMPSSKWIIWVIRRFVCL